MFNKNKRLLILLLMIVGICAISSVSASDVIEEILTVDDAQLDDGQIGIDEVNEVAVADGETLAVTNADENLCETAADEADKDDKLTTGEEDYKLAVDESQDKLSMIFASWYSIDLSDTTIASDKQQSIKVYVNPSQISGSLGYDFNFIVIDKNGNNVYTRHCEKDATDAKTYSLTLEENTLAPGSYIMAAVNTYDNVVMDKAYLYVSGTAAITVNNYYSSYMSGAKMTGRITDQVTGKALSSLNVKVVFSKGKVSVTKYYNPDSNGYFSFEPPVGVGTWSVTITPNVGHITGSKVSTATIVKARVSIKASKVVEYKGFKTTLKATVKVGGKKVNEGKVTFKINGKTYKVKVKNGVATKKIKLKKIKTYKYTAKYDGNTNLKASKKVKAKAVLKKRLKSKIVMKKHYTIYSTSSKIITIKVKTTGGKNVKDGKIKIRANGATSYATVKNGKVKVLLYGLGMKHFKSMSGNTETYKKVINKVVKLKYIPTSHKYKSSSKKVKATSRFKCPSCGKTNTHNHYAIGYFYTHVQVIRVV